MLTLHVSQAKITEGPGVKAYWLAGYEGIRSNSLSFGLVELLPETKIEFHKHTEEEELIFIIEGHGKVQLEDGDPEVIKPGTTAVFPKNTNHFIENESKNVMKWCYCFIPPTSIEDHISK